MGTLSSSRGHSALAISTVFTSIATILAAIRIFTRTVIVRKMGADDWMIVVSVIFSWIFFGLFVTQVFHGMGEHYLSIPKDTYLVQMKALWASIPIYQTSLFSTKISIVLQYKRIFQIRKMQLACSILLYFIIAYALWTVITAWATCIPVSKFWDPTISGFCFNLTALWFSNSAIHIATDILILIYPMPLLKSLQLPRRQKLALYAVFALGGFVMVTSILRLKSLLLISSSKDPTYDNVGAAEWSAIECNVAIICACLPSIRAFISKVLPQIFSTHGSSHRSKSTVPKYSHSGVNPFTRPDKHTQMQSSVIGGHDDYALDDLSHSGSMGSDQKPMDIQTDFVGIKVTTFVRQESTLHLHEDGMGSTEDLVNKQSS